MKRSVLLLVLVVTLVAPTSSQAVEPSGPRLAISLSGDGPLAEDEFSEVITTGPAGEDPETLLRGSATAIGDGVHWSVDGSRFVFSAGGVESSADGAYGTGWPVVGLMTLDGGDPRVYPQGFLNGGEPLLSPDGLTAVFQRVKLVKILPGRESYLFKVALWTLKVESGSVKRLTRWRVGAFLEPIAFSPDGGSVVNVLSDRTGRRIVATNLSSRRNVRLARLPDDAEELTYSPDGTQLAYVRDRTKRFNLPKPDRPINELWVAGADGSGARRVLRMRGYITSPSWDPSGSRIAFVRDPAAEATGSLEPEPGNKVMAINADGTCLARVFSDPALTLDAVAWRPGPGREAPAISC